MPTDQSDPTQMLASPSRSAIMRGVERSFADPKWSGAFYSGAMQTRLDSARHYTALGQRTAADQHARIANDLAKLARGAPQGLKL